MHAIQTHALTRVFAGGHGVRGIELAVPEGAIYGFLGPNGAGKTTTIRLLLGLIAADQGSVQVFGRDLTRRDRGALRDIGAMVENPSLYLHLSARDNLQVSRCLLNLPRSRIDEVLQIVDLGAHAERRVQDFSLGMRQRLGIALALLNRPRLLILDEPTNGLDPAGIVDMRHFIQRMTRELGLSVFLSSHLLGEIEQLATHVGVVDQGLLLFQGSLAQLHERSGNHLEVECSDPEAACMALLEVGENPQRAGGHGIHLRDPQRADHEINAILVARGHAVHRLARSKRTLETLFFELTGKAENAA